MATNETSTSQNSKVEGITIRKEGTICIHSKTKEKYGLEGMKFASPTYDASESVLTIKSAEEPPTSFAVSLGNGGGALNIKCPCFLDQNQISFREASKVFSVNDGEKGKEIKIKTK
ncbi:MAG: hypothetical protein ABSF48_29560 [Thermodesulfobacteriota bacterium]|jgi:hypothetical protein